MTNKVAVVTGGHRGIGFAIATRLAKDGFDLAVTGREDLQSDSAALVALREHGGQVEYIRADVSSLEGHQPAVDRVVGALGPITCLVNNAGIASVNRADFLELLPENFDRVISINLRGTVFFTQAVVRSMLESASGHARTIVNITSVNAIMNSLTRLDYCMTKAALSHFNKGLALRLADENIGVFEVRPGMTRTDMTATVSGKYDQMIADGVVPMRRWGEPSDIADVVGSLASGQFNFSTGSAIDADGGLSLARF